MSKDNPPDRRCFAWLRTPLQPTQEEKEVTDFQSVDWKALLTSPKYIAFIIIGIIVTVLTILLTVYHDQVVTFLRPHAEKIRDLRGGYLIFIAILFIISFPPLFGHEVVGLLCGVVYGLYMGFLVVATGTFLGEVATWFFFKKFGAEKAAKLRRTNLNWAGIVRMCRDGGFWIIVLIRLSAIPSHFSTAVFATCGSVGFGKYALATFLTLPKQALIVYLGVLLVPGGSSDKPTKSSSASPTGAASLSSTASPSSTSSLFDTGDLFGTANTTSTAEPHGSASAGAEDSNVKNLALGIATLATIISGVHIYVKMRQIKKELLIEQDVDQQLYGKPQMTESGGPAVMRRNPDAPRGMV
ncbi:hypothetical protein B0T26DRAFT_366796 [Lasiosphaeria miniovina]|uniref:Golgi apparatus membrane protein TVP38 n=1 Tax=Lasiosphaeria miniovina TaxID=1954250 RepID=A0AA40ADA1_9PEZI|nr:uncharacterized protein B0T26DRAFT_366796 [Lasiosphaeria miniovina]KAK0713578.1 hypothetical protein B0T26DRAFT_366796 [Lasiosphaeria miniovina]